MRIANQSIELVPIDSIQPHPANPRQGDIGAISESLDAHGFFGVVVCQVSTRYILAGNHRWKAAKFAEATEVPVAWVDCDDDEALRILLADNRTSDLGTYDTQQLADLLEHLHGTSRGLTGTGYDGDALDELLDDLDRKREKVPDSVPPPAPKQAVTLPGDIIYLGHHRLVCGDATDPGILGSIIDKASADLVLTDPPYNVAYQGGTEDALTIQNDDLSKGEYAKLLTDSFRCMATHLRSGASAYVFHADSARIPFASAFADAGLELKQVLIWVKSSLVLGRQDYQWQHEPILYGWKPGAAHRWYGEFDKTTVIDEAPKRDASDAKLATWARAVLQQTTVQREAKPHANRDHPTPKPVPLLVRLMSNSTREGDLVLDPFAGSGSTLMAAEHLGRRACLVELDPIYCDVIVGRWEEHTGKTARRP